MLLTISTIPVASLLPSHGGDGTDGFVITSDSLLASYSVSSAGDFNGDGFDDLLIGSHFDFTDPYYGRTYLVFGTGEQVAPILDVTTLDGTNGFAIRGIHSHGRLGQSVSTAGDVNGDGFDDIVIGSPDASPNDQPRAGESYVIFGKPTWFSATLSVSELNGANGFALRGIAAGNQSGWSVSSAGDINGDGFDEVVIGAPYATPNNKAFAGESYVIFGKASGFEASLSLAALNGSNGFALAGEVEDQSGWSVSSAGDFNSDGFDDLIVGSNFRHTDNRSNGGSATIVFGKADGFVPRLNLSSVDGVHSFAVEGNDGSWQADFIGISVASAGDINGDGFDDVLIGAPYAPVPYWGLGGKTYVVFGHDGPAFPRLNVLSLNGQNGFEIAGAQENDCSGLSVSSAGDVNGDGFDDLIIGDRYAHPNGQSYVGEAYLLFGKREGFLPSLSLATLNSDAGITFLGTNTLDQLGISVRSAGDVNGDGYTDFMMAAFFGGYNAQPREHFGHTYVFFGQDFTERVTHQGTSAGEWINGSPTADVIVSGQGNDTILGLGGADAISTGQGDDRIEIGDLQFVRIDGGRGNDRLVLADAAMRLNLASAAGQRLLDIEEIELTGTGDIRLVVAPLDLLQIAPLTNRLVVHGTAGNSVLLSGVWQESAPEPIGAETYRVFVHGQARLKVQSTVTVAYPRVELTSLTDTDGFSIHGQAAGDQSGWSVSSAGDVNGDGFDDLLIGARYADPNGRLGAGTSYVLFGKSSGHAAAIDLAVLQPTDGFAIHGAAAGLGIGFNVSSAGDVNGDGFSDLLLAGAQQGIAYLLFGKAVLPAAIDLANLSVADGLRLTGGQGPLAVAAAGDVNGDGYDDLILGASEADPAGRTNAGESFVVFGRADGFPAELNLLTLDGFNGFALVGNAVQDLSGISVGSAGDINGDGFSDVIIGARDADPQGRSRAGESYVVFGKAGPFLPQLSLAFLDGTDGFVLRGIDTFDFSGFSVGSAGDINGDGFDDLLIGAYRAAPNGQPYAGESYVVFGKASAFAPSLNLSTLNGTAGFTIQGAASQDASGWSVRAAGDVNGDGYDDLLIGAPAAAPQGLTYAGVTHLLFGRATPTLTAVNLADVFAFWGGNLLDLSGFSVASAGDVDGDGLADLIIGAPGADPMGRADAGQSYLVFGKMFREEVSHLGSSLGDVLVGGLSADWIVAGAGHDALVGQGGADTLLGGQGDDIVEIANLQFVLAHGGRGTDRLSLTGSGLELDLPGMFPQRLFDLEEIDLSGSGDNRLIVSRQSVLQLAPLSNTLLVTGNVGDFLEFQGTWNRSASEVLSDGTYRVYVSGAATVKVHHAVTVHLPIVDLTGLTGTDGFSLVGFDRYDQIGWSVTGVGDFNGDGLDDIAIGAENGINLYLVFGRTGGLPASLDLDGLDGTYGIVVKDFFTWGSSVGPAGDVNGDGYDDLAFGSIDDDRRAVLFGRPGSLPEFLDYSFFNGINGFVFEGVSSGSRFSPIRTAGDINGDGFDDVIIGSYRSGSNGEAYVVFGKAGAFPATLTRGQLDGTNGFVMTGETADDRFGYSVSAAGDFNGDGLDDLFVGAPTAGSGSNGVGYVIFGKAQPFPAMYPLSTILSGQDFLGIAIYHFLSPYSADTALAVGTSVSSAGDVNGDGYDDLIIGGPTSDKDGQARVGHTYVVFGRPNSWFTSLHTRSIEWTELDGTDGFLITGAEAQDLTGWSVSGAGDVNGDGLDDLLVGSYNTGSYVLFGKRSGFAPVVSLAALQRSDGLALHVPRDPWSDLGRTHTGGFAVSSAGDFNGDGFDDVIIGAPGADIDDQVDAGAGYVFFGADFIDSVTHLGTQDPETLRGSAGEDVLVAGAGDDRLIGNGGHDVFLGGAGDDIVELAILDFARIDGGRGSDRIAVMGADVVFDLTTASGNLGCLIDIEQFDLTGTGDNRLVLSKLALLELASSTNTLLVYGNVGDSVQLQGTWSTLPDEVIDGATFQVWSSGAAILKAQRRVTVIVPSINLALGTNGFTIMGAVPNGYSGWSVSSAGDVNGDGFDDIMISAPGISSYGPSGEGQAYVVFGKAGGFSDRVDLASLDGTNGFTLHGRETGESTNWSVGTAGDINGDGFADLVIGAPSIDFDAGESYVVFGKAGGFEANLQLAQLNGTDGFVIPSIDHRGGNGVSVSTAGDVNGDGFDDLVIGVSLARPQGRFDAGKSYVIFGKASGFTATFDLAALNGSNGFVIAGATSSDRSGSTVGSAGDVNGDGFADILIGAIEARVNGRRSGAAYVIFGKAQGFAPTVDLALLDGQIGFALQGPGLRSYEVVKASSLGDINGDGFADLAVVGRQTNTSNLGSVVFGKAGGFSPVLNLNTLNGSNGFSIQGGTDYFESVSAAGDVNGDGYGDWILGSPSAPSFGYPRPGETYLIFGKPGGYGTSLNVLTLNGLDGITMPGLRHEDGSGASVRSAGDINGDGYDDLIIGAPSADPNGRWNAGESYVVFGRNFVGAVTHQGTNGNDELTGRSNADAIIAGQGNDTLIGGDGPDVLRGGQGDDWLHVSDSDLFRIDGGAGTDTLQLGDFSLDLTQLAVGAITDIEIIDLANTAGSQTLILDSLAVLNLSTNSNELLVHRTPEDQVPLGEEWLSQGVQQRAGRVYQVYRAGEALLWLEHFPINSQPIADAGGPYTLREGDSLTLDASGSSDPDPLDQLTYLWDVNGDGIYGDATGISPTLTWAQLNALGVQDGPSSYPVSVRVEDGWGVPVDSVSSELVVTNAVPIVVGSGSKPAYRGEVLTFTFAAVDPSAADQAENFTYQIDWDGNGTVDQVVVGPGSGIEVAHQFFSSKSYSVRVAAQDRDGGQSAPFALTPVSVTDYVLRADGSGKVDLIWGGTNGVDAVYFFSTAANTVVIYATFENTLPISRGLTVTGVTGKVVAFGHGHNDVLIAELLVHQHASLFGGAGNDLLVGGLRADTLFGGEGNDLLLGGTQLTSGNDLLFGDAGDDVLMGHTGSDTLWGGAGSDLMLGDAVQFSDPPSALVAIHAEWGTSGHSYEERVANIRGVAPNGNRLNDNWFLTAGTTLFNDTLVDTLIGEADTDWFIYTFLEDLVPDRTPEEHELNSRP
jgi:Ca2+-binding RTX toxin-like protein